VSGERRHGERSIFERPKSRAEGTWRARRILRGRRQAVEWHLAREPKLYEWVAGVGPLPGAMRLAAASGRAPPLYQGAGFSAFSGAPHVLPDLIDSCR
jgi:hypothetical protein